MNSRQRRFVRRNQTEIASFPEIVNVYDIRRPVAPRRSALYHVRQAIRRGLLRVGMFTGVKANAEA